MKFSYSLIGKTVSQITKSFVMTGFIGLMKTQPNIGDGVFVIKIVSGINGNSTSEVSLGKGVLKICYKFTDERTCRCAVSIKLLSSNFIEIAFRHGCSPVHLLHIFRIPFPENTSGRLLLHDVFSKMDLNSLTGSLIHLRSLWHCT